MVPEIAAEAEQVFRRVLESKQTVQFELYGNTAVSRDRVWDEQWYPVYDEQGEIRGVGVIVTDITARKLAENALRESQAELNRAQALAHVGSWRLNVQRNELRWSDESYRIAGIPIGTPLSYESFLDIVHPEDREYVNREWKAALEGKPYDIEHRLVVAGQTRWAREQVELQFDARGQLIGGVGAFHDITERKRAEEALKAADHRKDEFLATLAHELRNPLAPLRNGLEVLRRASQDSSLAAKTREMMERQVAQMTRLVDDLLDISRITSGKLRLRKKPVDIADVLSSAVETVRPLIDASAHELTVSVSSETMIVQADPIRLAQVFANLLNNASKYTEKSGHIWLTADRRGDEVVVSVRDTGIGIPAGQLEEIFEIFSQAQPALERSQGGLGIGLSLVKGLVELHGGTIEARSGGLGKGSEFTVHIPIATAVVEQPRASGGRGEGIAAAAKMRIVVVDDLRDAADALATRLKMMGHDAFTAYDGLEAVQAVAAFKPDMVFLDIGLPKMNGYEAAQSIRAQPHGKEVTLVALTGWGQQEDRQRAAQAGFDQYFTKPVDPQTIEALIAQLHSRTRGRDRSSAAGSMTTAG